MLPHPLSLMLELQRRHKGFPSEATSLLTGHLAQEGQEGQGRGPHLVAFERKRPGCRAARTVGDNARPSVLQQEKIKTRLLKIF